MRHKRKGGDGGFTSEERIQPICATSFAIGLVACSQELPPDEDYPEPWQQSAHPDLIRTLANHQIQGCGECGGANQRRARARISSIAPGTAPIGPGGLFRRQPIRRLALTIRIRRSLRPTRTGVPAWPPLHNPPQFARLIHRGCNAELEERLCPRARLPLRPKVALAFLA
jgi:hypothetical protein